MELGVVFARQNQREAARHAFEQAIAVDPKYVNPLLQLALLVSDDHDWKRVAELTDRAMELDPLDFPVGFFYNAVAHYNLNHLDIAEKSARRAQRLDGGQRRLPQVDLLLGRILMVKKDYPGALDNLRAYLQKNPKAEDAEDVRKQVAAVEQLRTASAGK
jgi:tetratricopeptide (TPR) repeat protein